MNPQPGRSGGSASRIDLTRGEFERRLAAGGRSRAEIDELWEELAAGGPAAAQAPRLGLGGLIAIHLGVVLMVAALGSLLGLYWGTLNPWGVLALGLVYLAGFIVTGELLRRRRLTQPANFLQAVAVGFVPLVVYAILEAAGLWPDDVDDPDHIFTAFTVMAAAMFLAGLALLASRPNPLVFVPLGAAAGLLAADLAETVFGTDLSDWQRMSFVFPLGVAWLAIGLWLDVRRRRSVAQWAHWVGLVTAGASLGVMLLPHVVGFVVIGVLGAIAMFFSAFVRHWSYTVVGALGVMVGVTGGMERLGGAAPLAAAVLGLALIVVGLRWARWRDALREAVLDRLPAGARALVTRLAP